MARKARPYQIRQFTSVRDAFRARKRKVIVESPTGTGKTVCFVLMSKMTTERKKRVLILVNRTVLVDQTMAELRENGLFADKEQAESRASLTANVVVASIQSLEGKWLDKWPRDHFDLVLLDECHGSSARTFKRVLDRFENAHHVGFTATPERHDKKGLWKGYSDIVFSMSLKEAIDEGWLCGFDFHDLDCRVPLDERLMKKATYGEDEEVFNPAKYLPMIADCAAPHCEGKKSLFFLPNCRMSNAFTELLKAKGLKAEHIDSSYMPPKRTEELLRWYAETPGAILCNADLLSVGFNRPEISLIGLIRPIASTPMYKQRLGRGTRPIANIDDYDTAEARKEAIANSAKPFCTVLNVFWENVDHDLAAPSCLITDNKEEQAELNKGRKAGQQIDLKKLEDNLKAKRMENQAEEERKLAEMIANSQEKLHRKKKGGDLYIADILRQRNPKHKVASARFVRYIRSLGADIPPGEYSSYQMMRIRDRIEKLKAA